jgi:hypothetical protein
MCGRCASRSDEISRWFRSIYDFLEYFEIGVGYVDKRCVPCLCRVDFSGDTLESHCSDAWIIAEFAPGKYIYVRPISAEDAEAIFRKPLPERNQNDLPIEGAV